MKVGRLVPKNMAFTRLPTLGCGSSDNDIVLMRHEIASHTSVSNTSGAKAP